MDSYDPTDQPSGYPSLPKHVDDVIQSAPWDPLVSVRSVLLCYIVIYISSVNVIYVTFARDGL